MSQAELCRGLLPVVRVGDSLRYSAAAVVRWLEERSKPAP